VSASLRLAHAFLQRRAGWRQDENAYCIGNPRTHLARALPIDFQQDITTGRKLRIHRLPRSALPVAVHARMLEEVAGIDHRIDRGLQRYEPGAGGEFKYCRGFEPSITHIMHFLSHPGFAEAVDRFLDRERQYVGEAVTDMRGRMK